MKIRNWTLLITLSALACFFYFYITPGYLHPAEDASILFNYAQNLKETGVISYYPDGPRVDGSTDFLFLTLISGAMFFVSDAYQAALLVSGLSTMMMLFFIFRLLDTKSLTLQYIALLLVIFSQQIWAAVMGYGTFLFAMSICWVVLAYWKGNLRYLSIVSVIAILCRPDALVTVIPLILYKLYTDKGRIPQKLVSLLLYFVLPLAGYGAFRYLYFGSILPLSFDINTSGNDKIWGLFPINSIHHVKGYALYTLYPALIGLFIYFLKSKFKIRKEYYVLIISTVVLPMLAYLTIRENLDFSRRYFIVPYLGLVLTMCLLIRNYKSIIISITSVIFLITIGKVSIQQGAKCLNHYYNNIYDLSGELTQFPELKLATSEAGIITWKSRLATLDLWGLNTPELTNRLVTPKDIQDWNPDILFIHTSNSTYNYTETEDSQKTWSNMTNVVIKTVYEEQYLTYLIPYDNRTFKEDQLANLGLLKSFLKFISENNQRISSRQELIAIHPKSPRKVELMHIIEQYGGKQFTIRPIK